MSGKSSLRFVAVEWQRNLPVIQSFDELVEFVNARDGVLLRYSNGPWHDADAGPSRDYEADVDLPGLSATTVTPEPWWPRPPEDWIARRVCKYAELGEETERYPWLLTGDIVGCGPDHEPLVVDARPLARISQDALDEARTWYQKRFKVGKDSR
ncbi:hypothetical protein E1218_23940 [Kribbella turkmenica]|uniref:Uncharacterized protein n=1 Tax=Kribbella turkmenica TaxID=2530375 RepID=A0A4R4WK83_9ACTN|nr:DUF6098 family protein [Kribbella turkmenica]TDD19519.1 hypothetical protein E1218_23940 [Kribbella turkmenica]